MTEEGKADKVRQCLIISICAINRLYTLLKGGELEWWYLQGKKYIIKYPSVYLRRRQWHPTPVLLPGESQGRGSLVGCRLWGRIELDMTEQLSSSSSLSLVKFHHCIKFIVIFNYLLPLHFALPPFRIFSLMFWSFFKGSHWKKIILFFFF